MDLPLILWRCRKPALLGLCLAGGLPVLTARLADIEGLAGKTVYLLLACALAACLLAAAHVRQGWLRWPLAGVLAGSALFMGIYERVTIQFLSYDAFINLVHSAAFAGDAAAQNGAALIAALPWGLALLLALGLRPRRDLPLMPGWALPLAPAMGVAALAGLLFMRGGDGARGLPASFTPLAYGTLAAYEAATGESGARQPVRMVLRQPLAVRTIVLIIDESIAPQYLDINSPLGVPTPLSRGWPGVAIDNLGIAAAINNCSVGSNVTLRHGGTRAAYRRINALGPSIFAYARKAGLRTVYIDAQRTGGALQNLMDEAERAQIDRFIQFDAVPVEQRDQAAAAALLAQMADPAPKFVLVNKVGAHFPVHDKYPDAYMRYRPVLERGRHTGVTDTGNRDGFSGTPQDWRRYRNAYRNTLLWNVGAFFETLLARGAWQSTAMIYTSDHGQDLHERGNPGTYTHCSADPVPAEGAVPLVLLRGADVPAPLPADRIDVLKGRASHYMIFPELLRLMGYDRGQVARIHGPGLDGGPEPEPAFNALFNARLNRKPVWVAISPATLPQPPQGDGAGSLANAADSALFTSP